MHIAPVCWMHTKIVHPLVSQAMTSLTSSKSRLENGLLGPTGRELATSPAFTSSFQGSAAPVQ